MGRAATRATGRRRAGGSGTTTAAGMAAADAVRRGAQVAADAEIASCRGGVSVRAAGPGAVRGGQLHCGW